MSETTETRPAYHARASASRGVGDRINHELRVLSPTSYSDYTIPEQIMHPTRLGCMLKKVDHHISGTTFSFRCDDCRMPGEGTRYILVKNNQPSDSVPAFHTHCALATPTLQHPLVKGTMKLHHEAPAGGIVCSAFYETVQGFHHYSSKKTNKGEYPKLHPCCAKLPMSITLQGEEGFTLELRAEVDHNCTCCQEIDWEIMVFPRGSDEAAKIVSGCATVTSRGDEDKKVMFRLLERADESNKLEKRIYKILIILVRAVIKMIIGDLTGALIEGLIAIVSLW
uniref:Uncharacterized protein n=1 Tax=Leersia perrieri TaxID=77586 RepID=A0A0D9X5X0_9ORYZ